MELVDRILQRITESNLKTNPLKCDWGAKQTNFLEYEMTPTSAKSLKKKIGPSPTMECTIPLETSQELLGSTQLYTYMWPRHTHVLAPLTRLTGHVHLNWDPAYKQASLK